MFTIERIIDIVCVFSHTYILTEFSFHFSFRFTTTRISVLYVLRSYLLLDFWHIVNCDTFSHAIHRIYLKLSFLFRLHTFILEFYVGLTVLKVIVVALSLDALRSLDFFIYFLFLSLSFWSLCQLLIDFICFLLIIFLNFTPFICIFNVINFDFHLFFENSIKPSLIKTSSILISLRLCFYLGNYFLQFDSFLFFRLVFLDIALFHKVIELFKLIVFRLRFRRLRRFYLRFNYVLIDQSSLFSWNVLALFYVYISQI